MSSPGSLVLHHRDVPHPIFFIKVNSFCLQVSGRRKGTVLLICLEKQRGIFFFLINFSRRFVYNPKVRAQSNLNCISPIFNILSHSLFMFSIWNTRFHLRFLHFHSLFSTIKRSGSPVWLWVQQPDDKCSSKWPCAGGSPCSRLGSPLWEWKRILVRSRVSWITVPAWPVTPSVTLDKLFQHPGHTPLICGIKNLT